MSALTEETAIKFIESVNKLVDVLSRLNVPPVPRDMSHPVPPLVPRDIIKREKERVRKQRYRARQKSGVVPHVVPRDKRDIDENLSFFLPSSKPLSIQEHSSERIEKEAARDKPEVEAVELYNLKAKEIGWPKASKISETRKSRLKARLRDAGGLEGWAAALDKAAASKFCRGEVKGWKLDLDFLLQEQSFIRLMEGRYDDRSNGSGGKHTLADTFEKLDAVVDEAIRRSQEGHEEDSVWLPGLR